VQGKKSVGKGSAASSERGAGGAGDLIEIFADGACSGNPGPGGYAAILRYRGIEKEISGCEKRTTNNRMELTAVIEALRLIKRPSRIRVTTDSEYVVKGMTQWIPQWIRKNWINAAKKPVLNRNLWETLLELSRPHKVEWAWIRGHAGHGDNERCDRLAREAIRQCRETADWGGGIVNG
jgi:ribonuclease HI